ncbi:hypothetical protein BDA99DRAFT_544638 [Phascolomyces articulosus]|uniref:Uncharacterized protein n=1 Tax=Phascolomyces articulosus TaxID=60185 RepID=A0AAD5JVK2_9FUNG|nr:hypothetical protein BDA99DRAFT_544638 [Phascolomyces articulosus]
MASGLFKKGEDNVPVKRKLLTISVIVKKRNNDQHCSARKYNWPVIILTFLLPFNLKMNTEIQQTIQLENLRTPYINPLSQYIRDVYQDIVDWENIEFDYNLTTSNPANMRIITNIIVGMRAYQQEFPGLVHFDLKVCKMAITSFNNKHSVHKCIPAVQEIIDHRNHRASCMKSKHDRRVCALEHFYANLEEKYPSSRMDKFLEKGYMSEEESEDENWEEMPFKLFRPDYQSENANKFLGELDQLASLLQTRRQHKQQSVPRNVVVVNHPRPTELVA